MDVSVKSLEVHPEDRDLISRLAALQDMHDQVLDLRTLLPQRLWNPILATIKVPTGSQPSRSPSALLKQLEKTADDGCREIGAFKAAWHSIEVKELWQKTKTEAFPQGTDTWKVDYRTPIDHLKEKEKGLLLAAEKSTIVEEEPKDVIDRFRTKHPKLKLEISDADKLWPLTLTVAGMSFEINKQAADDATTYDVVAKTGRRISNVQQEVLKIVRRMRLRSNLVYLLDLLASYDGIMTRACDKCQKIIDDSLQFALVRQRQSGRKNEDSGDEKETQWLAYHQKCAP